MFPRIYFLSHNNHGCQGLEILWNEKGKYSRFERDDFN